MPADVAALRRATRAALTLGVLVLAGLVLLFTVVLHPVVPADGCTSGLYPGTYADALVPAHLVAFVLLAGAATWLGARREGRRRPPPRAALAIVMVFVLAGLLAVVPVVGAGVLVLAPLATVALAVSGGLHALAAVRADAGEEERWRALARLAEAALWGAVYLVLPLVFVGAYFNGSGLFCF